MTIGDKEYEDDTSPVGPANYFQSESGKWAYSSTGSFVVRETSNYIAMNVSTLNMSNLELYTRARLSPLSLKYYGLCLQNGSYNVSLHFAEIIFTDDHTFSSVGRRLFDVSIQVSKSVMTIAMLIHRSFLTLSSQIAISLGCRFPLFSYCTTIRFQNFNHSCLLLIPKNVLL